MASYDPYDDRGYSSRRTARVVERDRRDERDPRYAPGEYSSSSRVYPSRELVPRSREESDLSIEEVRRDFPPPSGRDVRRARSGGYYEDEDDYYDNRRVSDRRDRDLERSSRRSPSIYEEDRERKPKHKSMSKQEKILAAVAGAVLAAGGKELYDRREAKEGHTPVHRNALSSAALAGVGALAAYQGAEFYSKQQAKKDQKATYILHHGRDGQVDEYYSSDDDSSKEKKGHKNFLESALAATGLGAAVKSFTGGGGDDKSDTRSRDSRSPSKSRSTGNKVQKAAMASLLAGATEAFRVSKEPGGWRGEKTKRILTAAAGAATVDAATGNEHGKLGLAESVIGGLVGNRLINGSRNEIEEDKKTGRSRSRSRAGGDGGSGRGGLAALATAGLGALAGKKILDNSRSRSRGRDRSSSREGRSPSRDRRRSRSRSVVDKARDGLAKLGIGAGAGAGAGAIEDSRRRDQDDYDDRSDRGSRRSRRYDDDYDDDSRYDRDRGYDDDRSYRGDRGSRAGGGGGGGRAERSRDVSAGGAGSRGYSSGEDLGDSDEDEKRHKKLRGKQVLTTGLAAVATIHAAHEVYESFEKRQARQKAVREGQLSEAEAKKLKSKALLQDAASVGIAALGVRAAYSGMKEAKHMSHETKEFKEQQRLRHLKREQYRQRHLHDHDHDQGHDPLESGNREDWRYHDDNPYGAAPLPAPR